MYLSIVIPLYNEEESVSPLIQRVHEVGSSFTFPWELILVDDGSSDSTWSVVSEHLNAFPQLRAISCAIIVVRLPLWLPALTIAAVRLS